MMVVVREIFDGPRHSRERGTGRQRKRVTQKVVFVLTGLGLRRGGQLRFY